MIYKIADYHRDVLGRAAMIRMGRVSIAECRAFRELLDGGEGYPKTSPQFEDLRTAGYNFLAECDEARGIRAVTIDPPEPGSSILGAAIDDYCKQFKPDDGAP